MGRSREAGIRAGAGPPEQQARAEIGRGNKLARNISNCTTGTQPGTLISAIRTSGCPRIAVTDNRPN